MTQLRHRQARTGVPGGYILLEQGNVLGTPSGAKILTRDEARRIAANI